MPVQTQGRQWYNSNPFAASAQERGGVDNTTLWLLYPWEDPAHFLLEAGWALGLVCENTLYRPPPQ